MSSLIGMTLGEGITLSFRRSGFVLNAALLLWPCNLVNKRKHNLLFLSFVPEIGGAEISTLLLLEKMDRNIWNPVYVMPSEGPLSKRARALDVRVDTMQLEKITLPFPGRYMGTVWRLARFIRNNHIDLVACTVEICNQYGLPAARLNRIPIVCHTRNMIPDYRSFWRTLLHFPDLLIANSRATAESYRGYLRRGQKVVTIHNGVDLTEFAPMSNNNGFRKRYGINRDDYLIGVIARISPHKRQDLFITAMVEVVRVCPNAKAVIVGETFIDRSADYMEKLRRMVTDYGLEKRIIFTGFVENMRELYAALDMLVLPSTAEPFGRVLIEAMAMELPIVATRSGGAVEIVDDEKTGRLVNPDDPVKLADAIKTLYGAPLSCAVMGKAGRERVELLFSIEKNIEKTQAAYLSVLGNV
ncbi:MAG: glycosyltransferase family 4 protein [bacterium]